jgi:flagellar biosynthesis chaperone FliJ
MKKFHFPLSRVIDWREAQARLEESKLEGLYAEQRAIDARKNQLSRERESAENAVAERGATGSELARLGEFHRFSAAEHARLEKLRDDCGQRIAAQIQAVTGKRRDARLLERLKQQKLIAWNREFSREIDAQAEEAYLAKWNGSSGRIK